MLCYLVKWSNEFYKPKYHVGFVSASTPGKLSGPKQSAQFKHKPKMLFHTNTAPDNSNVATKGQRSPLRILSDSHIRSPLGKRNVDVNSPRVIMQRKQTTKLSMLRTKGNATPTKSSGTLTSCRYEAMSDDKENISI